MPFKFSAHCLLTHRAHLAVDGGQPVVRRLIDEHAAQLSQRAAEDSAAATADCSPPPASASPVGARAQIPAGQASLICLLPAHSEEGTWRVFSRLQCLSTRMKDSQQRIGLQVSYKFSTTHLYARRLSCAPAFAAASQQTCQWPLYILYHACTSSCAGCNSLRVTYA